MAEGSRLSGAARATRDLVKAYFNALPPADVVAYSELPPPIRAEKIYRVVPGLSTVVASTFVRLPERPQFSPQELARRFIPVTAIAPALVPADAKPFYPVFVTTGTAMEVNGETFDFSRHFPPLDGPAIRVFCMNALLLHRDAHARIGEIGYHSERAAITSADSLFTPLMDVVPFLYRDSMRIGVDPSAVFIA